RPGLRRRRIFLCVSCSPFPQAGIQVCFSACVNAVTTRGSDCHFFARCARALREASPMTETLKLIQFRAAYNLPVHAGIETGIFARHGLALETAYTPGSLYISRALKEGEYDI